MQDNILLSEYNILDTVPEQEYDEITKLASYICESPISLITLLDGNRQFFKSHHGTEMTGGPVEHSFCKYVQQQPDKLFEISDARSDQRFKDNPYVSQDPNIIFYAGYPIKNSDGVPLANICVIDHKPKKLTESQRSALKSLSNQVGSLLELRKNKLELEQSNNSLALEKERLQNALFSLEQRNQFIEKTLENLPLGIMVKKIGSGEVTIMNKHISKIYGWPKAELKDTDTFFKNIFPDPVYKKNMQEQILTDIQSGEMGKMHWENIKIRRKDGEERIVDAKNIPLIDQDLMISTVIDVTENERNREHLAEFNERFNYVTKATSDTIWDSNLLENTIFYGENFEQNFGHQGFRDDKKNLELWNNNLHPDDKERVLKSISEVLGGSGNNWREEYRFRKADGSYLNIEDEGFIVRNKDGMPIRMVGAMKDITRQKEREQQLRIFESVIEKSNDPIIIADAEPFEEPNGPRIMYVNEAFTKVTGYSRAEIIGKTPRILQGPKSDKKVLSQVGAKLRAWENIDVDILNYTKTGEEFWVNLSIAPVADEKGWFTHWISIQKDITEQKNRELYQNLLRDVSNVFNKESTLEASLLGVGKLLSAFGDFKITESWLVSSDGAKLNKFSTYASNQEYKAFYKRKDKGKSLRKGEGLPGITWETEDVQNWQNLPENELFIRKELAKKVGLQTGFGLPLKFNEKTIGVLLLGSSERIVQESNRARFLKEFGSFLGSEIARKQLEEELNQLMNFTPDFICSFDEDGWFKRINPAFSSLFEDDSTQTNLKFIDVVHPEDKICASKHISKILKKQQSDQLEVRCLTKTNKTVWVAWTITPAVEHGISYCVGKNITDKKELEELFEVATELAQVGSWEVNLVENTSYWSKMIRQIHEVPKDFVPDMEKSIEFFKEGAHRERFRNLIEQAISTGKPFVEELLIVTHNEKEKWIKVIAETERINGNVVRIFGSFQDIHLRKLAEQERIEILESIGDGFFAVDTNLMVTYWNKQAEVILKTTKEEILGKSIWEVFDENSETEFYVNFNKALGGDASSHFEGFMKQLGIWLDVSVYSTKDSEGFTVYLKDITIRKEAMEEIKISNDRFAKVVRATQDAIWDWDVKSHNVFWGNGFFDRFGYSPVEKGITIETWSKLVHPSDQMRVFKSTTNALKDIKTEFYSNEYRLKKSNETYAYVIDNACIIRNEKGVPLRVIGAIQDISERKLHEESLKRLNRQLENKAKQLAISNAELEQFAYVTSHDLQEPLRMITSFLSLLENKYKDSIDEKGKRYIHFAVDGAKRMREIILELLEYSRVGNSMEKVETVDVGSLLQEVLLLHKKQIMETKAIVTLGDLPTIKSFKTPLRQIFLNLVSNALKYQRPGNIPKISVQCKEEGEFWKFTVKDNGIGIDPKYVDKIFIIFQRLHNRNEYSGIGMGLAITKKIVESLGGKITVNSTEGEGSEFNFSIKNNIK